MIPQTPHFNRFISVVHRRMVVLRGLERIGVCLLIGAVACLLWMAALLWRGQEMGWAPGVILGVAVVTGAIWGFMRRPTRFRAAMETDRQLKLNDLLSSAMGMRQSLASQTRGAGFEESTRSRLRFRESGAPVDEENIDERTFSSIVLALADEACARSAVSGLRLHRLGARSWGGIGLAMALVGAMAFLGADPSRSHGDQTQVATGPVGWQEIEDQKRAEAATRLPNAPDYRRPRAGTGGDEKDPINAGIPEAVGAKDPEKDPGKAGAGSEASAGATASVGAGAASGSSQSPPSGTKPETPIGSTGSAEKPVTGGTQAGTGGTGSANAGIDTSAGIDGGAASRTSRPTPVWRSSEWPAAQKSAREAVAGNRVPDAYRDLVRDYFERE